METKLYNPVTNLSNLLLAVIDRCKLLQKNAIGKGEKNSLYYVKITHIKFTAILMYIVYSHYDNRNIMRIYLIDGQLSTSETIRILKLMSCGTYFQQLNNPDLIVYSVNNIGKLYVSTYNIISLLASKYAYSLLILFKS
jgi:hypothetical protein